jgi:hypothetical protein
METWEKNLLDYRKTIEDIKSGTKLRHSDSYVKVSDISRQFYCEAQVDLTHRLA